MSLLYVRGNGGVNGSKSGVGVRRLSGLRGAWGGEWGELSISSGLLQHRSKVGQGKWNLLFAVSVISTGL